MWMQPSTEKRSSSMMWALADVRTAVFAILSYLTRDDEEEAEEPDGS